MIYIMKIEQLIKRAISLMLLKKEKWISILRNFCKVTFLIIIYLSIVLNCSQGKILLHRNSFLWINIWYWSIIFLIYFGRQSVQLKKFKLSYGVYINYILFIFVPLVAFYIEETIYNPFPFTISINKVLLNYGLYLGLQIGITLLLHTPQRAYIIILFLSWIYGIANYYVMEFKGNPLLPSDLMAYKTAATVVGNYEFVLSDSIVIGTLVLMTFLFLVQLTTICRTKQAIRSSIVWSTVGIIWLTSFLVTIYNINWCGLCNIILNSWRPQTSYYENGALLTFLLEVQELSVSVPQGYSRKEVTKFLDDIFQQNDDLGASNEVIHPSVIAIMNESFSDLAALGEFGANDCLENWYGISDYVMRGNAYASVIGGGTCNSEFEFLTGNSMANLSSNGYPYQMYNFDGVFNLAAAFSENGYDTIAIHPAYKYNWNRPKVYSQFGFNNFISISEMESPEYVRYYVSDQADFDQVIATYENRNGPVFIFNVTMQNHGGYEDASLPDSMDLAHVDRKYMNYTDVITYLSLIRESDKAFANFLEYFSKVEDPVIICMFGDHQPNLNNDFFSDIWDSEDTNIESQQKRCCVPYIIWSNYDIGVNNVVMDTSLNYLGMNILELAGFSSPYSYFLTEMQKVIPAVNKYGYLTDDGIWNALDEPNELLTQYQQLQYYMLFDHSK